MKEFIDKDTSGRSTSTEASLPFDRVHPIVGPDGRWLAVEISGDPNGYTIFLLHGSPGSRIGPKPDDGLLHSMGIRLVTYDRPGYGYSDPNPGRRPTDTAEDVRYIFRYLGDPSCVSIIGRSGGGPHTLACAVKLPEVKNIALLASPAPYNEAQSMQELGTSNAETFQAATEQRLDFSDRIAAMQQDPFALLDRLQSDFATDDRRIVTGSYAINLQRSYREACRPGQGGWLDDYLGTFDWGFNPGDVIVPTLVWYGGCDRFVPPKDGSWLASNIPLAQECFVPEAGHFRAGSEEVILSAIGWCVTGEYRELAPN